MSSILILGGDSDFNLGDAAILKSVCHSLVAVDPGAQITITSRRTQQRLLPGVVRILPRGPDKARLHWRAAAEQDLVVIGGGGLFQDDDSRAKMPYWASRLTALRLANRNIVGHCLGAGPLRHAESRQFAKLACAALKSVSVRDGFAQQWLSGCTNKHVPVVPDPAFMLPPAAEAEACALLESYGFADRRLVGVALRGWFHRRGGFVPRALRVRLGGGSGRADRERKRAMAALLDDLAVAVAGIARELDADVLLMPSYSLAHEGDVAACEALQARLPALRSRVVSIEDPSLYKAVAGRLSLMVSARMHPLILAASMGVPVVALAYNEKFAGTLELLGVPGRSIPLDDFAKAPQAARVLALAHEALGDSTDLAARAAALAEQSHEATAALLEGGR